MTIQQVGQIAKEITLEQGYHSPMLLVEGSVNGLSVGLQDFPAESNAKQEHLFKAGFAVGKAGTVGELRQVFFISEAWMSAAVGGKIPDLPPSKDPRRVEVLIITSLTVAPKETDILLFELVRDPQGHLLDVKETAHPTEKGSYESPLMDAFLQGYQLGQSKQAA